MFHICARIFHEDLRLLERELPVGMMLRTSNEDFLRAIVTVDVFDRDYQLHLMRKRCAGHVRRQQRFKRRGKR
jgi:hypothetical protein